MTIVNDICDLKHICTQSAGRRPFGVSLLVAGVDEDGTPKLFETDPTGIYFQYKAKAVGLDAADANKLLEKGFKANMKIEDGLKLGVQTFKRVLGKEVKY